MPARDRFSISLSLSFSLSFPLERRTSLNDVSHLISENAGANAHRESNIAMHRVSFLSPTTLEKAPCTVHRHSATPSPPSLRV
jgi:hypothetical protein